MYFEKLDRTKFVLPVQDKDFFDVFHIFNIRSARRDELKKYLLDFGVKTEIHYPLAPNKQEAMKGILGHQCDTPIAEEIHNTTLSLPISAGHSREDIERVVEIANRF
ncbi:MAG TPA: DegT/DnrJ/EryC1/StrS family aminotransferase [Bacteroidales bacterium]|nr:DegT/DnrJ/EryC1/StrS family aminotransferase [Bacteroidales bacterium]